MCCTKYITFSNVQCLEPLIKPAIISATHRWVLSCESATKRSKWGFRMGKKASSKFLNIPCKKQEMKVPQYLHDYHLHYGYTCICLLYCCCVFKTQQFSPPELYILMRYVNWHSYHFILKVLLINKIDINNLSTLKISHPTPPKPNEYSLLGYFVCLNCSLQLKINTKKVFFFF